MLLGLVVLVWTVLGYNTIKKLLSKNLLIENANNQNINASSYDVTVDKYILKFTKIKKTISFIDDDTYNQIKVYRENKDAGTREIWLVKDSNNMLLFIKSWLL